MIIQKYQEVYGNIGDVNQMIVVDSNLFKFKSKLTKNTDDNRAVNVAVGMSLKFLVNF